MAYRRASLSALIALLGLTGAGAGAASFDCKRARGQVETAICADAGLSALDEQLAAAYARALQASPGEKAAQLAWLRTRNACADAACLRQAYGARIAELQARPAGAAAAAPPASPGSVPQSTPTTAAACDGLPRLHVKTAPGFCLGLVADGLKAPRGLAALPDGGIVVADMGSWGAQQGRIWLLRRGAQGYTKTVLFDRLDRPNGLVRGPDGKVYVGMPGRVTRFAPGDARPVLADVIGGASGVAPLPSRGRHLLPAVLFDARGDLIVSVGSASDHCENADGAMPAGAVCAERTGPDALGVIRKYTMAWPAGKAAGWAVLARGLRNSMAMAIDARSGQLWQADNGRDNMQAAMPSLKNDDELPHDELNPVVPGADYGWPYCYDGGLPSPEYPNADCRIYRAPSRLLPAHAAPLGMAFYTAPQFPAAFRNSLIVTYHGYRKHGHRVVALLDGGKGAPSGQSVTLVEGERGLEHGIGAPVALAIDADGNVLVSDDHGGIVARLHYEGAH
jgi:glucose/arabinose dehydrogenase